MSFNGNHVLIARYERKIMKTFVKQLFSCLIVFYLLMPALLLYVPCLSGNKLLRYKTIKLFIER